MGHFHTEIHEQPAALARLLSWDRSEVNRVASLIRERRIGGLVLAARGSSDHAAQYAGYLFGAENGLQVTLARPSLHTLYESPPSLRGNCIFVISQSGESGELLTVLRDARRQHAMTVAITNDPRSSLAVAAEHTLLLHAGEELGVPASKTYTAELLMLALVSATLSGLPARIALLESIPRAVEATLSMAEAFRKGAQQYAARNRCMVLGRGYHYATACELALKLKETCYLQADAYSSADFLHGPIAMVDRDVLVVAFLLSGRAAHSVREALEQCKRQGAEICTITDYAASMESNEVSFRLPVSLPEHLSPIPAAVAGQLFALGLAESRGIDPDHPRGLAKVTSTK